MGNGSGIDGWTLVLGLGLFVLVMVAFAWLQLIRQARARQRAEHEQRAASREHEADQARMVRFRDQMMARVQRALREDTDADDAIALEAVDEVSFTLTAAGESEASMHVVLTRVLGACLEHPEEAERFQAHFARDVARSWVARRSAR